jgi:hypothetical protein
MRRRGELAVDLPPNFFPFIKPEDPDWHIRYSKYNNPGEYHNGGIWPFVSGFYVAALVAGKRYQLAEKKLVSLTRIIKTSRTGSVDFGFNEWLKSQDGKIKGTLANMERHYLAQDVLKRTPFDEMRSNSIHHRHFTF